MPVRFGHVARPKARQVLQYVVNDPLFVVVGTDRSFEREVTLHWLPGQNRGVPCTQEDCPWCPLPPKQATYLPALAYSPSRRSWKEKVIYLTERMEEFLDEPRELTIWEFLRSGYKNAPVKWKRYEREKYLQPFAGFDVEESLWKIWGMFGHARRNSAQPGHDRELLFDEVINGKDAAGMEARNPQ